MKPLHTIYSGDDEDPTQAYEIEEMVMKAFPLASATIIRIEVTTLDADGDFEGEHYVLHLIEGLTSEEEVRAELCQDYGENEQVEILLLYLRRRLLAEAAEEYNALLPELRAQIEGELDDQARRTTKSTTPESWGCLWYPLMEEEIK